MRQSSGRPLQGFAHEDRELSCDIGKPANCSVATTPSVKGTSYPTSTLSQCLEYVENPLSTFGPGMWTGMALDEGLCGDISTQETFKYVIMGACNYIGYDLLGTTIKAYKLTACDDKTYSMEYYSTPDCSTRATPTQVNQLTDCEAKRGLDDSGGYDGFQSQRCVKPPAPKPKPKPTPTPSKTVPKSKPRPLA